MGFLEGFSCSCLLLDGATVLWLPGGPLQTALTSVPMLPVPRAATAMKLLAESPSSAVTEMEYSGTASSKNLDCHCNHLP